eukprot:CAMPEP_0197859680 /NCGR_PEP_ID=MMETSP1438-20131217/34467_1 /TAXON_ID=1461541 /ORGANISM="Pterosperma sp., Strain CCMP1384" /LENGTH=428 /DNA_ID=CAMNT_0043476271 /DNA_START=205 /DNA_END=1491 /DNA_ORIENTATION=-
MPLSKIVEEACSKCKTKPDPSQCGLKLGKTELDLTLNVRFANLARGCKLELVLPAAESSSAQAAPAVSTASTTQVPAPAPSPAPQLPASPHLAPPAPPTTTTPTPSVYTTAAAIPSSLSGASPSPSPQANIQTVASPAASVPTTDAIMADSAEVSPAAEVSAEVSAQGAVRDPSGEVSAEGAARGGVKSISVELSGVEAEVGRQLRVILPSSSAAVPGVQEDEDMEEDEDFYSFTAEDFARMQASKRKLAKQQEDRTQMRTKQLREKEITEAANRLGYALIKIRFPNETELEGCFHPLDSMSAVYKMVRSCIQPSMKFSLFVTPPRETLPDSAASLYSLDLAPAALVRFAPKDSSTSQDTEYLRPDVLSLAATCQPTLIPAASSQAQDKPATTEGAGTSSSSAGAESINAANRKKPPLSKGKPKWLKL